MGVAIMMGVIGVNIVLNLAPAVVFLLLWRRLHSSTLPTPASRFATYLVGHMLDGQVDLSLRHRWYTQQQELLGPVYRYLGFWCGLDAIIVSKVPGWYRKTDSSRNGLFGILPNSLLGLPMGPAWATQRKAVAPLFSRLSVDSFLPAVHAKCAEVCELWRERAAASGGAEQDVHPQLLSWSLDIFGRVACAHDFEALACDRELRANPYAAAAKTILDEVICRAIFGRLAFLQRGRVRAFQRAQQLFRSTAEIILRRADEGSSSAAGSLAAKLAALSSSDGCRVPRSNVAEEVMGLMVAGHETSSNTAAWALHLLATHPVVQQQVREEVAHLELGRATLGELYACPLLQGVMYEALRLHPTVPIVRRVVPPGAADIAGHKIPAGAQLIVSKVGLGNDPTSFPQPARFDPARFGRGEFGEHGSKLHAFGLGPRLCVGYRLAEAEVLSLLAHVLRHFQLAPGSAPPTESLNVTLAPADGLLLRLAPLGGKGTALPPHECSSA